MIIDWKW